MIVYPGGTLHDVSTEGYSFTNNFFSDMGTYAARNGDPNYLSMIIFAFSLTIVGITFSFYYLVLPNVLGEDRINYVLAIIGTVFAIGGSICMIGTGLTPSDIVHDPHVFFANNIFHCFLITAFVYTIVIFRSEILKKRYSKITQEIRDRLKYELSVIIKMGYAGYFLISQDFVNYAKSNNIPVGPGRGSAAGSIVAYSTGITDVDPLKYNLLFERFLNPERVTMPDIDCLLYTSPSPRD